MSRLFHLIAHTVIAFDQEFGTGAAKREVRGFVVVVVFLYALVILFRQGSV